MWILYQTVVAAVLVTGGLALLLRRRRHYLPTLRGRLGQATAIAGDAPVWLHAVSVGEARVAAVLAAGLPSATPLLVTTITPTGQQQAATLFADRGAVAYFPFDLGFAVRRFFDRHAPRLLIAIEGDLWPLVLRDAGRRGVPVLVANGRVGERSFRRWRRLPRFGRWLHGRVAHYAVQTPTDAERLRALGVGTSRITVTGNLKFDQSAPAAAVEAEELIATVAAGRPIVVAGSTMEGEDRVVVDAFRRASRERRGLLVLAPRHPERWSQAESVAAAAGLDVRRRSALSPADRPDVVVLDSLGELAALYRLAAGAFVGGTLVPTGGHNPIEPALFAVPVAAGPSMGNFDDIARRFDEAEAWTRVDDEATLASFFGAAIDGSPALEALGAAGAELVAQGRGAIRRTLAAFEPWLAAG